MPSDINLARLIDWAATIAGTVSSYEATARDSGYPSREEREEALQAMRDAQRKAALKVKQVWESVSEYEESQKMVKENSLESNLTVALSGLTS